MRPPIRGIYPLERTSGYEGDRRRLLEAHGATMAMVSERVLAVGMTREALQRYGVEHDMAKVAARTLRR